MPCRAFEVDEEDLSGSGETAIGQRIGELLARPFDLSSGPLFRSTLLRAGEADHILVAGGHHTVLDGWSLDLLLGEVAACYSAHVTGGTAMHEPIAVQYGDYAAWQRTVLDADQTGKEGGLLEAASFPVCPMRSRCPSTGRVPSRRTILVGGLRCRCPAMSRRA